MMNDTDLRRRVLDAGFASMREFAAYIGWSENHLSRVANGRTREPLVVTRLLEQVTSVKALLATMQRMMEPEPKRPLTVRGDANFDGTIREGPRPRSLATYQGPCGEIHLPAEGGETVIVRHDPWEGTITDPIELHVADRSREPR